MNGISLQWGVGGAKETERNLEIKEESKRVNIIFLLYQEKTQPFLSDTVSVFISFSNNKSVYHFSTIFCACHNKSHNGLSCYFLGRWQEKVTTKGNLTDVSTSGLLSASSRPYDGQQSLFSQHKCLTQKTLMMVKEQNPHKLHRKIRTLLQIKV